MTRKSLFLILALGALLNIGGAATLILLGKDWANKDDKAQGQQAGPSARQGASPEIAQGTKDLFSEPTLPGRLDKPETHNKERAGGFVLPGQLPRTASAGQVCIDRDLEQLNAQLTGYRAGFTELNDTRENANKITLASIDWKIRCDSLRLIAEGEVQHANFGTFSVALEHRVDQAMKLDRISARLTTKPATEIRIVAIEMRANEQRRGQILSSGIQTGKGDYIGYDASTISEQASNDASVLYHNSEWIDLSLRRGDKRILLAVELPVVGETRARAN